MSNPDKDIESLRELLLEDERRQIEALRQKLESREARLAELSVLLPEALRESYSEHQQDLGRALEAPLIDALERSAERQPQRFADILFPVIGPAIRKSIAEALRSFADGLNQTLDHSLSPRGLRWRLEAMRTGVPFSAVVLKHTLRYQVEEIFLIQRNSGLLVAHASQDHIEAHDNDAISAMLIAIQDFVRDAFASGDEIGQLELGERLLWLFRGSHLMLAALIRGVPPAEARDELRELLERLESDHRAGLVRFCGDADALPGIADDLNEGLISETKRSGEAKAAPTMAGQDKPGRSPGFKLLLMFAVILIVASVGWHQWHDWQEQQATQALAARVRALTDSLDVIPGVFVLRSELKGDQWVVHALRDPQAESVAARLAASGLSEEQLRMNWVPYRSLDSSLSRSSPTKTPDRKTESD